MCDYSSILNRETVVVIPESQPRGRWETIFPHTDVRKPHESFPTGQYARALIHPDVNTQATRLRIKITGSLLGRFPNRHCFTFSHYHPTEADLWRRVCLDG